MLSDFLFVLSKVFWFLVQPSNLLAIMALPITFAGARLMRGRFWRIANAVLFIFVLAFAVLPLSDWLTRPLEQRFAATDIDAVKQPSGIIVLGGVIDPVATSKSGMPAIGGGAERFLEMLYLARRFPDLPVVYSGGSGNVLETTYREADAARILIERIGLDSGRFIFESDARNTFENAVNVSSIFPPRADQQWLLVTSAMHMPRSIGVFRKAGFNVIPYPVDFRAEEGGPSWFDLDLFGEIFGVSAALKEWIGLLAYRLLGRSDSWFPSP